MLVADDEESILRTAGKMLDRMGFETLAAPDGQKAVELFREHQATLACVVLDLTMPRMNGEEAFVEMRKISGEIPIPIASGFAEEEVTQRFAGRSVAGFIHKPYELAALREKMKGVLGS